MSELKTVNEMANLLRVSAKTFRNLVNEYNLPFIRAGNQKRFDERKILQKLESHGVKNDVPDMKMKRASPIGIVTEKEKEFARNLGFNV